MKEYKTINKKPDENKFPIQKQDLHIMGKILYITSSPSPNKKTFILTDKGSLYVFEEKKKKPEEYPLKSDILRIKKFSQKPINFQTDDIDSQIWSDKKGNHVIIKYKNVLFYYNPFMEPKVEELHLILPHGNILIQPFAVAFNEENSKYDNTGTIILSDYYSSIYEVQLILQNKEMVRLIFGELLRLKPEIKNQSNEKKKINNLEELKLFELEEDDRIMDMKLFTQKDKVYILAITKKMLFQFTGKNKIKYIFDNYKIENGSIIKAVKKFLKKPKICKYKILKDGEKKEIKRIEEEQRESYKYSRIQLINKKNEENIEYNSYSFMSDCGYISTDLDFNFFPQKKFNLLKYYKINIQNEEKQQLVYQLMPKTVCESKYHLFFLYSDYLVVQNKLTNEIKHDEYKPYKFIDMYYNEDSIVLYNENDMFKISLENEYNTLYEDYIEKGDYKTALELTKDDKYIRPLLHKLYADRLFDKKLYLESALEYAFSNEIFENVCLKFLNINNISGLLRYLALVMKFRINNPNKEEKEQGEEEEDKSTIKKDENDRQFIEKYLINTWLLELLIDKYENDKSKELIGLIRVISRTQGNKYLDSNILYFWLHMFGKEKELIEYAYLKKDYHNIITYLISRNKITDALEQFKGCVVGNECDLDKQLKNYFYNYGHILIRENIKSTIDLLMNYFPPEKPEQLIKILISPDFNKLAEDQNNFKLIKDLMRKPYKIGDKEINITKEENLHNLYILLVSYSLDEKITSGLYDQLKSIIKTSLANQQLKKKISITDKIFFDLNFAKKIFKAKEDEKSKKILCLIYFFLKQYIDSIDIAMENNFRNLLINLTKAIPEENLMKKIWLKIFQYEKDNKGLTAAKEIIKESQNLIKIEDVIPLMGDDEKLIELKDELKNSILYSENSVRLLNKEIIEFNESNTSIKKDIELSEKKAIRKKFTELKCSKCDKSVNVGKNTKFFLFPCQHIFDLQCLIDTYMEFQMIHLGDKKFETKIGVIKDLSAKISSMEEKKSKAMANKEKFGNEEEYVLNNIKKILYDYLDDECLLCGQEMIDSTQIEFNTDEKFEWDLF